MLKRKKLFDPGKKQLGINPWFWLVLAVIGLGILAVADNPKDAI